MKWEILISSFIQNIVIFSPYFIFEVPWSSLNVLTYDKAILLILVFCLGFLLIAIDKQISKMIIKKLSIRYCIQRSSWISLFSSKVIVAFCIAVVIALVAAVFPSHLWLFLVLKCLNFCGQWGQEYGFSPVWIRKCVFNWCCWANWRPHSVHWKYRKTLWFE